MDRAHTLWQAVAMMKDGNKMFPALLKYWRKRRGLSQLDLALTAGVSSKHISFLETGRSAPSIEMVMLLGGTLDVPLRDRNDLLRAAGFGPMFDEPTLDALAHPSVSRALDRMLAQQEPFPMFAFDRNYNVLRQNKATTRLLAMILGEHVPESFNVIGIFFDHPILRDMIVNWEQVARDVVSRLHRETLHRPNDPTLAGLLSRLLASSDVPESWRTPDFSHGAQAIMPIELRVGDMQLGFLTTVMQFQAPQNITLEELRIEGWFPLDEHTEAVCTALAAQDIERSKPSDR
ncbi:MAG: helix-turn-helix transcriptional regulator [Myxococcota bacterium]